MNKGYDFDDVLLLPLPTDIKSRDEVDISVDFKKFKLSFPIIASPMKGIISYELVNKLSDIGGLGIFSKFESDVTSIEYASQAQKDKLLFGVSVGLESSLFEKLLEYNPAVICIDMANGYLSSLYIYAKSIANYIAKNNLDTLVMAGNVVTWIGTKSLIDNGVNLIRVGIGNGSLCITRNVTGVGCPQLTALDECSNAVYSNDNAYIICDGGIRNSGDIVKALTFGADCVMIGGMFGRVYESANENGIIYGGASRQLQEEYYHSVKSVEGVSKKMKKDISTVDLISELNWGIKSACTYLDSRKLKDLWNLLDEHKIEVGTGSIKRL